MSTVSTNIRIDSSVKKESTALLEGLGLSLSDAVNMFLRQTILHNGLPFEVKYPEGKPSAELDEAIKEVRTMSKHPEKYKVYTDVDEALKDLKA